MGRLSHYDIDAENYDQLFKEQSGQCAICGDLLDIEGNFTSHIDHDHITGKIRGILCRDCNLALGNIEDKLANNWAEKAQKYLIANNS